ncbi:NfeD family protein [Varunaivibrio sulfuroxidans]|uniref:NfeD-like C-terminal domain-containing protein n=1 Tax=Varunaivibrio sulfuroxidans TaxID=1773489 RepID=A0A4R3J673_9PROT|nr:NfeD family protein [Varunaivibrio sulfuroxidans]TCS61338.1 hypothetical protein EDD55_108138 [Varunaivibrio sulfuroxidans]WES31049.1 NfeD family protein [Varunaivibrio sulfuroxidans]
MDVFLGHLTGWHWLIVAVVFIIIESIAPGFVFLWVGISAALIGVALFIVPGMPLEAQGLAFAVLSVGSIVVGRVWMSKNTPPSDHPVLNQRGAQYIGRHVVLDGALVNGYGKIRLDDTSWTVVCAEDIAAGRRVEIVGVEGTSLRVIPC